MRLLARIGIGAPMAVALGVWLLAAGFGTTRMAGDLSSRVHQERLPEDVQRNSAWSPIYGFADVCQADIPPSAGVLLVDPTGTPAALPASERTGPSAFGLPAELDWPNQAAFAYVLYPRAVAAVGHVPSDWIAEAGSARYVAIWEQQSYRSADAQATARQAEGELASQPAAEKVCTYSSLSGDRGVVYRLSMGDAGPAPSIPAGPSGGRAGAYLGALLGLGSMGAVGFVLLRLLPHDRVPLAFTLGASLPVGGVATTLELIAFSVARIGWSAPLLAAPWVACAMLVAWQARDDLPRIRALVSSRALSETWRATRAPERIALAALVGFVLVIVAGAPLGLPWSDGFDLYYFKSRAFFSDGSVLPFYQHAGAMLFSFPAHPPLVSLSVTWLYLFIGQADEHVTLLLWPATFISMLLVLYALARVRLARRSAIWFVLAAALVGYEVSTQALLASFADLPLAVFLLLACGALWLWAGDDTRPSQLLVLAGVCLAGAALTKEEGLVAAGIILAASPLLMGRATPLLARSRWAPLATALPVFALLTAPWFVVRARYQLPELTVHLGSVSTLLSRMPAAVGGLGVRAAAPLLPFVALALIAALARPALAPRLLSGRFWFVTTVVVLLLGVDAAAIAAAPVEVHHQLAIAGTRLVSQVLPLAFLASIEVWPLIAAPSRLPIPREQQAAVPAVLAPRV